MHRPRLFLCKNNKEETKQFRRLSYHPSQNLPKRRVKEIPRDLVFDLDRIVHGHDGIIFAPVRKSEEWEKKLLHVSRNV